MATTGVTKRRKRATKPPEQPVVEAVSATVETAPATEKVETKADEVQSKEAPAVPEKPMPEALQKRVDAVSSIYADLQKEIDLFKSGEAYLEGDVPITMRGLGGPGFNIGQRTLNWIDERWLDPLKHFRWSNKSMVDYHRGDGYQPADAKEFTRMVRARGGDHHFTVTPEGHLQSGDLILIETSKDWHAVLVQRSTEKTRRKTGVAKNRLYAAGEERGVEVYEGGEAIGPKMGRLLEFLEKELGPGVTQAFLGR